MVAAFTLADFYVLWLLLQIQYTQSCVTMIEMQKIPHNNSITVNFFEGNYVGICSSMCLLIAKTMMKCTLNFRQQKENRMFELDEPTVRPMIFSRPTLSVRI